jgi:zinc-binding alcohol dehydrogenase family protein
MKAIGFYESLPIENEASLQDVEVAIAPPTGRDLLVRVKAVSVNPVDIKVRSGGAGKLPEPRILGFDAAGVVEAVGDETSLFQVGDAVFYAGDITRAGSNSELQLVDERIVGQKPQSLTFAEAAAVPLTAITAWEALFDRMGIPQSPAANVGKTILIIGGAGGVGSIGIQLAKQVAGLQVVATASREETAVFAQSLGADHIINHYQSFQEAFKRIGLSGVEYILCTNKTASHLPNMVDIIKPQGKIALIVSAENNQALNINPFMSKSVALMWELMFTRPMFQTEDMQKQHDLLNKVSQLLDTGVLRTTMTENFGSLSAESLRRAHAKVETGTMMGKLVLGGIA